jgi:hypothetical protein
MFDNESPDVFANIPDTFRPDRDTESNGGQVSQAPTPAAPAGMSGAPSPDGLGGRSPDGLGGMGAYARPMPEGLPTPYPQDVEPGEGVPMGQWQMPFEPMDVSPDAAIRSAGMTTLVAAVSFGAGLAIGGWKGGIAGILLSGGAFNLYRAQKWWGSPEPGEKHEAVVSSVMGLAGVAGGGYAAYKAYTEREEEAA